MFFLLEHANKRNLKAVIRHAMGAQNWSPYTPEPHEFVELNIDFHPVYIQDMLRANDFEVIRRMPVSYLRLGLLKNNLPTSVLVWLDGFLQQSSIFYSPSIFAKTVAVGESESQVMLPLSDADALFAAPETGNPLQRDGDTMVDAITGTRWAIRDGIYDFKAPLQ